jgi:hypothetical protein
MGEDEFELISRQELERLRQREQTGLQQQAVPEQASQDIEVADAIDHSMVASLNLSLDRLNSSLSRLLIMFDKAQKEVTAQKPDMTEDKFSRIESQNEKIASGIVALANMIRDQQIQINQFNLLFKGMQERMDELRLQRRPTAAFKISPSLMEMEEKPVFTPPTMPQQESHQIEIEIPRSPSKEILEEEKHEDYQTLSMFSSLPPPPQAPLPVSPQEPVIISEEPPPLPEKKGILKFLKK